jgi:hypothetical protein
MSKIKYFLIIFTIFLSRAASGTAQSSDKIILNGKEHDLLCTPLESLEEDSSDIKLPNFWLSISGSDTAIIMNTGNWRGYVATWEIVKDTLYLIKIDNGKYDLSDIFGNLFNDGKVFASWYTGDLRVVDGPLVNYIHMGFMSTYEREKIIEVENGIALSIKEYKNNSDGPPSGFQRSLSMNLTVDIPNSLLGCSNPFSDTICFRDKKDKIGIYGTVSSEQEIRFNKLDQKLYIAEKIDSCLKAYNSTFAMEQPTFENQRYGYVGWIKGTSNDRSGMICLLVMSNLYSRLSVTILMKGNDRKYFDKVTDVFSHSLVLMEFGN